MADEFVILEQPLPLEQCITAIRRVAAKMESLFISSSAAAVSDMSEFMSPSGKGLSPAGERMALHLSFLRRFQDIEALALPHLDNVRKHASSLLTQPIKVKVPRWVLEEDTEYTSTERGLWIDLFSVGAAYNEIERAVRAKEVPKKATDSVRVIEAAIAEIANLMTEMVEQGVLRHDK